MAWIALVGGILSAAASVQQGRNEKAFAEYQAQQTEANAQANQAQAELEANTIRKAGERNAATARAALAASGVSQDSPTALSINREIYSGAENDALNHILTAQNQGRMMESEAQAYRIGGKQSQQAGYLKGVSSLLGAAGNSYGKGWK